MKKSITILAVGALLLASCTTKPPVVEGTQLSQEEKLTQGKTIFNNTCGKCHKLPEPTAFTSVEWVGIMNSMAPKAKLTDEQHQWVYDYIVSVKK